ncbi:MAG: PhzF family phenazine biosynthesis protein [Bacteroidota bacterium]|nr:PhzF family phenazine biosynthesis protein [Bacteroidota bacterium]
MNQVLTLYQVDAFSDKLFQGNPAGVCILKEWLNERLMQKIAAENNLPETAFIVQKKNEVEIRWFTPTVEVDLCGHATLASAHVLFSYYSTPDNTIHFYSPRSGKLEVERNGEWLTLDFPKDVYSKIEVPNILVNAFQRSPIEAFRGKSDFLLIFNSQKIIEELNPDLSMIASVGGRGVIVSAPGNEVDFVSRFFAPQSGINEDPVTGSAHTTLAPYWSKRTGKKKLTALQLSKRRGELICEVKDLRVLISGKAVTYLIGEIAI